MEKPTKFVVFYDNLVGYEKEILFHKAKKKENHKCDGFGNVIKDLHKLAKLSPSFSPEVRICLRSCIKNSH